MVDEKQCEGPCYATVIDKNPPCPLQCGSKACKSYKEKPKADLRDHVIVWVYGGPSVGKTTQCNMITKKYGFKRIHVGELLKAEIASGSVRAKCLQNAIDRGELVPNDMALMLLKRDIEEKANTTTGFVIDSYPREERQGMLFEKNIAPCTIFIFLDTNLDEMSERHISNAPSTQKRWPTEKRNDNCVAGKLQINIFLKNHKHIFDQYPHKIVRINTHKRSAKDVFSDVEKALDKAVAKKKMQNDLRKAEEKKWKDLEPKPKTVPN